MKIDENPTLTDTRKFYVTDGNTEYYVMLPHIYNSLPAHCYRMTEVTEFKKGMEIISACRKYASENEPNFFEVKVR